jgi:hypothetical protein
MIMTGPCKYCGKPVNKEGDRDGCREEHQIGERNYLRRQVNVLAAGIRFAHLNSNVQFRDDWALFYRAAEEVADEG